MKIKIGNHVYDGATSATLADLIVMERETGISHADMADMEKRLRGMTPEEQLRDSGTLLYTGLTVWLARRKAGERLSLEDACDFPIEELDIMLEPGDRALDATEGGPTPDPRPAGSTRRSGQAGTRPAPADHQPKRKGSRKASPVD